MLTANLFDRNQISPVTWDAFVAQSPQGSLYTQSWYLDAVLPGWQALIVMDSGNTWQAVMPMRVCYKFGIAYAFQPAFCQHLGVLFAPFAGRAHRVIHREKEAIRALAAAIPPQLRAFSYNFHPSFGAFLPFLRAGFEVSPRLNLVLDISRSLAALRSDFSSSVTNHLKKSQRHALHCRDTVEIEPMAKQMTVSGIIRSAEERASLWRLWLSARAQEQGFQLEVADDTGQVHCRGLFLHDPCEAIFVASALEPPGKQLGANALLVWHAIQRCQALGLKTLNFKGSMLAGVEQFLLGFNPVPQQYLNIRLNRLTGLQKLGYGLHREARKFVKILTHKRPFLEL